MFRNRLIPTIFSLDTAKALSSMAQERGETLSVSIKVDTGMSRIGFPAGKGAADAACAIAAMPGLRIAGMFTHFACADEDPSPSMDRQLDLFLKT
ncbi:MAG: alanine racemase, partial [Firmicutes bacterium]|nr:alanine racemase [Bacillota bacterium]